MFRFFWKKTSKCSYGLVECIFDNPYENFSPKVQKFFTKIHSFIPHITLWWQSEDFSAISDALSQNDEQKSLHCLSCLVEKEHTQLMTLRPWTNTEVVLIKNVFALLSCPICKGFRREDWEKHQEFSVLSAKKFTSPHYHLRPHFIYVQVFEVIK